MLPLPLCLVVIPVVVWVSPEDTLCEATGSPLLRLLLARAFVAVPKSPGVGSTFDVLSPNDWLIGVISSGLSTGFPIKSFWRELLLNGDSKFDCVTGLNCRSGNGGKVGCASTIGGLNDEG